MRHQLFKLSLAVRAALIAATCYTGAYAKDTNVEQPTHGQLVTLSPADLDKARRCWTRSAATRPSAIKEQWNGNGLERVQAFVKGYRGGLARC